MSFTYDFADNISVSAENLNSIADGIGEGTIVSKNFDTDVPYSINKLNSIRSDILNPGVISGMECTCAGGTVSVPKGVAVFKNGMRIEITATETFPLISGSSTYVYLYASESFNCAMPIITDSEKTSDAYIPLAVIDQYGNLSDTRSFSTSKIPLSSGSAVQRRSISYDVTAIGGSLVSKNKRMHTLSLKDKYFSYVIFDVTISGSGSNNSSSAKKINGYYKRSTGLCCGTYDGNAYNGTEYIGFYNINAGTYIKPAIENGMLRIYSDSQYITGTFNMSLEVI